MGGNSANRFPVPEALATSPHQTWLTIRKSRFLTQTCHCATIGQAKDFIVATRLAHPDATHNCWAYVAGSPGDSARVGSSDDGEPHGTAGRPMLNALLHSGIGEICAVVSRWFGGIKLGTGGLVHAYQDSVLENLKTLSVVENVSRVRLKIEAAYSFLDGLRSLLAKSEGRIEKESYGEKVEIEMNIPEDRLNEFQKLLAASGKQQVMIRPAADGSRSQPV